MRAERLDFLSLSLSSHSSKIFPFFLSLSLLMENVNRHHYLHGLRQISIVESREFGRLVIRTTFFVLLRSKTKTCIRYSYGAHIVRRDIYRNATHLKSSYIISRTFVPLSIKFLLFPSLYDFFFVLFYAGSSCYDNEATRVSPLRCHLRFLSSSTRQIELLKEALCSLHQQISKLVRTSSFRNT